MNYLKPRNLLLPLLLLSAAGTNIVLLSPRFWLTARWVLVALLAVYLLTQRRGIRHSTGALLSVGAYVSWCALTTMWSDIPSLTGAKAIALMLVTFAGLWGGYLWVVSHDRTQTFGFLGLSTIAAVAAGLSGETADFTAGEWTILAGSTKNPNFLGTLVPLCMPVVLWRLYEGRNGDRRQRVFWAGAFGLMVTITYLTLSRGGYVILFCTLLGLLVSRLRWFVAVVTGLATVVLVVSTVAPDVANEWVRRNMYKVRGDDTAVLSTRELVWAESYVGAIEGGWTGVGIGVSAGSDPSALVSLVSSMGYGREKGNSQLAIVEETGLIGLGFYALLAVALFGTLVRGFARATGDTKVQLGIVLGTLVGLMAQSALEAWWVSPGSPEAIFFWVFAGAGLGLAGLKKRAARVAPARPVVVAVQA